MKFLATPITGLFVLEPEFHIDPRGFFTRTYCRAEFLDHGLNADINQCSISFNKQKGTLRGLHYQASPNEEAKLVRASRGAIFDVVLDLRRNSNTYLQHFFIELNEENSRAIYIPEGCAHGFQTLRDNSEVSYQMSTAYSAESSMGVRWNDAAFGINWPLEIPILSERDAGFNDWS